LALEKTSHKTNTHTHTHKDPCATNILDILAALNLSTKGYVAS